MAPFNNKALRQAIWYGVDRNVIQRIVYQGLGAPAWSPFPPSMWAQDRDFTDWRRDPAKAKAKLAEGGMPNGFSFTVKGLALQAQELQVIQAQLKDLGIDMKIETLEFGKLLDYINNFLSLLTVAVPPLSRLQRDSQMYPMRNHYGRLERREGRPGRVPWRAPNPSARRLRSDAHRAEDAPYVWIQHAPR